MTFLSALTSRIGRIRSVEVWPPTRFRLDYFHFHHRRAFLCYEQRAVGNERVYFISAMEGKPAFQQTLLDELVVIAKAHGAHVIFTLCAEADEKVAGLLKKNGYQRVPGGDIYALRYQRPPLSPKEAEPEEARRVRTAVVEAFEKCESLKKGVRRHPAFQDICIGGSELEGNFNPAVLTSIYAALKHHLRAGMKLADLGSGDGRVVLLAALLGADGLGMETRPHLIELAEKSAISLKLSKATFIREDFFKHDLSAYDVIFYAGATAEPDEDKLEEKLIREMKPEARLLVYREIYPFQHLKEIHREGEITVYQR